MLGAIDPAWRILAPASAFDREFLGFLALVTLVYGLGLAVLLPSFDEAVESEARRRGQIDDPKSISIELVEEPEKPANAQHGSAAPEPPTTAQQATTTPQLLPTRPEAPARPPAQPVEPLRETLPPDETEASKVAQAAPERRPGVEPGTGLDGVDLTMGRYTAALEAHMEHQRREKVARRASPPTATAHISGSSRVRGAPSSGQSDAYSRSVIAALLRAKPPPFALRGEVMVSFEISHGGGLVFVHVVNSSGNKAMDAEAVSAVRRARFDPPPTGKTQRDLTYIIHFIFE